MAIYKRHAFLPRCELREADKPRAIELLLGIMLEYGEGNISIPYFQFENIYSVDQRANELNFLQCAGLLNYYHDPKDIVHFQINQKGLDLCR